jgi:hypothetical protein
MTDRRSRADQVFDELRDQQAARAEQRQRSIDRDIAARQAERDVVQARVEREKAELAKQREADRREFERQQAEQFEAKLRARFDEMAPGCSDADFRAMRPQLIAAQAAADGAVVERMRARYKSFV